MRTYITLLATLALSACEGDLPGDKPDPGDDPDRVARTVTTAEGDIGVVVDGHNAFSLELYDAILGTEPDNVFFSPFSVTAALGMTLAGAEGTTATEMSDVLQVDLPEGDWHAGLGALTQDLSGDKSRGYTLDIANRLFGQEDYPWEAPFLAVCADDYGAPFEPWDFVSDPEGGRERVNAWVAEQTRDRIEDLLPPDSVTSDTRLVLANAIYFLADWATAFDPAETTSSAFTRLDGSTVQVPMMSMDTEALEEHGIEVGYADGAVVARLPYQDDEVSMWLFVPDAVDGLPDLEAGLDADALDDLLGSVSPVDTLIRMPRLEIRWELELSALLKELGMSSAFDGATADFTGMAAVPEDGRLHIDGVFHKAFVKVDEAGTEAAAATGVVVGVESAPPTVIADHPFLFLIRDDLTGAVLFVGRVVDPS